MEQGGIPEDGEQQDGPGVSPAQPHDANPGKRGCCGVSTLRAG